MLVLGLGLGSGQIFTNISFEILIFYILKYFFPSAARREAPSDAARGYVQVRQWGQKNESEYYVSMYLSIYLCIYLSIYIYIYTKSDTQLPREYPNFCKFWLNFVHLCKFWWKSWDLKNPLNFCWFIHHLSDFCTKRTIVGCTVRQNFPTRSDQYILILDLKWKLKNIIFLIKMIFLSLLYWKKTSNLFLELYDDTQNVKLWASKLHIWCGLLDSHFKRKGPPDHFDPWIQEQNPSSIIW